jgi:hypothetical protein
MLILSSAELPVERDYARSVPGDVPSMAFVTSARVAFAARRHGFALDVTQRNSWIEQISSLQTNLSDSKSGHIFLEFSIPWENVLTSYL